MLNTPINTFAFAEIPSLKFTKAELLYIVNVLAKDILPSDNSTMLELVELRHYLNQARGLVAEAAKNGCMPVLGEGAAVIPPKPKNAPEAKKTAFPTISELKEQFPHLSIGEIIAIIEKERASQKEETKLKEVEYPLPPPLESFAEKKVNNKEQTAIRPISKKRNKEYENAQQFASLLSSV